MCVCEVNNKDCMLHYCGKYPNITMLKSYICDEYKTEEYVEDFEKDYEADRAPLHHTKAVSF